MTLRILWFSYGVAALIDGYSRRLLQLKVYARAPMPPMASIHRADKAWHGMPPPVPSAFRAMEGDAPHLRIMRRHHGNDPRLPVIHISVTRRAA